MRVSFLFFVVYELPSESPILPYSLSSSSGAFCTLALLRTHARTHARTTHARNAGMPHTLAQLTFIARQSVPRDSKHGTWNGGAIERSNRTVHTTTQSSARTVRRQRFAYRWCFLARFDVLVFAAYSYSYAAPHFTPLRSAHSPVGHLPAVLVAFFLGCAVESSCLLRGGARRNEEY